MTQDKPHSVIFTDEIKKIAERIAALLELDGYADAFELGLQMALQHAEAHVKGKTKACSLSPEIASLLDNHPQLINALTEEGVAEWLEPFVLAKAAARTEL